MSYVEKKTAKRQKAIVSLGDYNQRQIDDLTQEEQRLTEEFEQKKEGILNGKHHKLSFGTLSVFQHITSIPG